jgi:hypothetical protein
MGQMMGKVTVEDDKAKDPEGPSFPDYMLDSNAVVSPQSPNTHRRALAVEFQASTDAPHHPDP